MKTAAKLQKTRMEVQHVGKLPLHYPEVLSVVLISYESIRTVYIFKRVYAYSVCVCLAQLSKGTRER